MIAPPPTQAGFLFFIRTVMGINGTVLPDNSPVIPMAYDVSIQTVYQQINNVSPLMYTLAVYNFGGDLVLNYAPDLDPNVVYKDDLPYFAYWRQKWNINDFVTGVVQSSSDVSTSQSMIVQKAAEDFTLGNIQSLKTPFGRRALAIAQDMGTIWGIS